MRPPYLLLQGLLAEAGVTCDDTYAQSEGNDTARRAGQGVKGGRTLKKLMTSFKAMGVRKASGEATQNAPRNPGTSQAIRKTVFPLSLNQGLLIAHHTLPLSAALASRSRRPWRFAGR